MKLSREQIERRQAQAPAGWRYDWRFAVIHGEHTLCREVKLDDTHFLRAHLLYRDEQGATRWQVTGRQVPALHLSFFTYNADKTAATSRGLGDWLTLGEPEKNKNFKALCNYGSGITEADILEIYNRNRENLEHGTPLFV